MCAGMCNACGEAEATFADRQTNLFKGHVREMGRQLESLAGEMDVIATRSLTSE